MKIKTIRAHEILDSRGNPTVEVTVSLDNGISGSASVPSGASTGSYEAMELRDGDKKRYGGQGVQKAVYHVNHAIAKVLHGHDVIDQQGLDIKMIALDGTASKSRLGANAILGVSLACAHAGAGATKQPLYKYLHSTFSILHSPFRLPYPMMNLLNGGRHADWVLDIQEFMVIPMQKKFAERVRCGSEIFHALHDVLKKHGYSTGVGDEGGFAPRLKNNEEAFRLLAQATDRAGYNKPGVLKLGIDAAASEFYNPRAQRYDLKQDKKSMDSAKLGAWYYSLIRKYPILSIEDPFAEDDWEAWSSFKKALEHKGQKTIVIGDDLYTTNSTRLQYGLDHDAANAILIKPNQIGTLTETMTAITLAQKNGYKVIISHRSGETLDTTIADLAVAVNADFIKAGSMSRGERVAKYNRLMEIEAELGQ